MLGQSFAARSGLLFAAVPFGRKSVLIETVRRTGFPGTKCLVVAHDSRPDQGAVWHTAAVAVLPQKVQ